MTDPSLLIQRDLRHVWHPCSQMNDFEAYPPIVVHSAKACYLYTNKGPLIDAISSWWSKSLGHGHPKVLEAIQRQMNQFEHVIAANTTHPTLVELAEALSELSGKQHVFFASDGSSAVEIALKLAIHANTVKGTPHKNQFIALKNAYHGETLGALSLTQLDRYNAPYQSFGYSCHRIETIPYLSGPQDPLWQDCSTYWPKVLAYLEEIKEQVCALIIEPIVQGAGGMLCYSADFLKKLAYWAKANTIYLIADEIMTGMGRTGEWLASQHAQVNPDLICLSKGLTSGTLPFSCVLIDHNIFELFYDDQGLGHSFLHSHTFSGHALAAAAALATIQVMRSEQILEQVKNLEPILQAAFQEIAQSTGNLVRIRGLGALIAADMKQEENEQLGPKLYQSALDKGALIRPLGNTLYWLPPLNTDEATIRKLTEITLHSMKDLYLPKGKG